MQTDNIYSELPYKYPLCLNRDCSLAGTCLRQLAEQSMPTVIETGTFINPKYLAAMSGPCPYYRPANKVRFGKGFIRLLESLPHKQMQKAILLLIGYFGRRTYYRVRKGERLLFPDEQTVVLTIIRQCGGSGCLEFDAYIEGYEW